MSISQRLFMSDDYWTELYQVQWNRQWLTNIFARSAVHAVSSQADDVCRLNENRSGVLLSGGKFTIFTLT